MDIYLVDDDPVQRMLLSEQLADEDRTFREFGNGEELLTEIDNEPDLILLDIDMPGRNGYETCRAWRDAGHADTQIIFISACNDLESRLKAYDVGGNDFIVKPWIEAELQHKVRIAAAATDARKSLANQAQFAGQTAFTAMSTIGEMGVILQFMRASFAAASQDDLVKAMFEAAGQYGLTCLIEIRSGSATLDYSANGQASQMEIEILRHASGMDRIFQFRDRMAINYPSVTLLFSGLPLDDPDKVGRLRDHLAVLAEGAHTRVMALDSEQARATQRLGISQALTELAQTLASIDSNQATNRLRAEDIYTTYLGNLIDTFVHLGLTDQQENLLTNMAQNTHGELAALRDLDGAVSDQLRGVVAKLHALIG